MANPLQLSMVGFHKNSYIVVEGKQRADSFFIIRSGQVRISREVEVVEEEGGNVLSPGDFFGVVSTMSSHSHIETAMAITDVSLIAVQREQYDLLIERNAPVAIKIIQQFSRKMRYLDAALTRLTFQSTASEDPSHLFNIAEYYARQNLFNQAYYAYYKYLQHSPRGAYVDIAGERIKKIEPYAKVVHLDKRADDFNRSYPKSTMIFSECEPGNELYIIQKGRVKISKIVDDKEVMLALLKTGDIFGEMALLEDRPRSASAVAHDEVSVLVVNRANFERMVQSQAQLITRLTQLLAERIWLVQKQLANALLSDPLGRLYDSLLIQLEKNRVSVAPNLPYTFDIGPKELISMVGLPSAEGNMLMGKLLENKKVKVVDSKFHASDVDEIRKQSEYFRKMEKIQNARKQSSQKSQ